MRIAYTYDPVAARRSHSGKCPVCGKRVTRCVCGAISSVHTARRLIAEGAPRD